MNNFNIPSLQMQMHNSVAMEESSCCKGCGIITLGSSNRQDLRFTVEKEGEEQELRLNPKMKVIDNEEGEIQTYQDYLQASISRTYRDIVSKSHLYIAAIAQPLAKVSLMKHYRKAKALNGRQRTSLQRQMLQLAPHKDALCTLVIERMQLQATDSQKEMAASDDNSIKILSLARAAIRKKKGEVKASSSGSNSSMSSSISSNSSAAVASASATAIAATPKGITFSEKELIALLHQLSFAKEELKDNPFNNYLVSYAQAKKLIELVQQITRTLNAENFPFASSENSNLKTAI